MLLNPKPYLIQVLAEKQDESEPLAYPYNIPAVSEIDKIRFHPDVTFFVGENGSGKSTVLEALALALGYGSEGGTKNIQLSTTDSVSTLYRKLTTVKSYKQPKDGYFLRAETFFNVATYMDETGYLAGYGGKSLHSRSHGEAFMTLLTHKFQGKGLYLMDEPEAALSPQRQLAALAAIHQLVQDDSQFIIATHSPILLAYPQARVYLFDQTGIHETKYEETDHYIITRDFLNNYPRRIQQLLDQS